MGMAYGPHGKAPNGMEAFPARETPLSSAGTATRLLQLLGIMFRLQDPVILAEITIRLDSCQIILQKDSVITCVPPQMDIQWQTGKEWLAAQHACQQ